MGQSCLSWHLNMIFLSLLTLLPLQLFVICDQDQVKSPHWVVVCGGSYLFSENYCLLDYAQSQSLGDDTWWWHSGNDIEREGVYRQADRELILWTPIWAGLAN